MEDLEKNLSSLPKYKLSKKVDFKIKFKIYTFVLSKNLQKFTQAFFHPHSLVAKVSLVVLMFFVVLGGTAVYAVSNDHITPGNTLYPLKKTIENVEQKISLTKSAKVETLNKLSERRLKEALNMAEHEDDEQSDAQKEKSKNNIEQSIEEAVNNFDSAIETSQKIINVKDSKKTKENLKKKQEAIVKYLDDISEAAKYKNNEEMVKKIDEAKKAINKHDDVLEEYEHETKIKSQPRGGDKNSRDRRDKNNEAEEKKSERENTNERRRDATQDDRQNTNSEQSDED